MTKELTTLNKHSHIQLYVYPLRNEEILDEEEVQQIFSNVEVLLSINSELLWALEERMHQWSPTRCIGDVFLNLVKNI